MIFGYRSGIQLVSEDIFHDVSQGLLLFDAAVVLDGQYHRVSTKQNNIQYNNTCHCVTEINSSLYQPL